MAKIKHSKYKNTAILYEVLIKKLMYDTMNEDVNSNSIMKIIRKFFNNKTELYRELKLYQTLDESKFTSDNQAIYYIDKIINARKNLDNSKLKQEKYNLVNEIKKNYNIEDFFKSNIRNYKKYASIYQIFEYNETDFPIEINKCKINLINENKVTETKPDPDVRLDEFKKLDKVTRDLAYKILIESFTEKSNGLLSNQREFLQNYISSMNGGDFLTYFKQEASRIKLQLEQMKVSDEVKQIKINEVGKLLCKYKNLTMINDNHIYVMLKYYELLEDVKKYGDNK